MIEFLQDYIKRFTAKKANIVGCNDWITSSAFKNSPPAEHNMYPKLTIAPSQTLAEVFSTVECYTIWGEDWIATKKCTKQVDPSLKAAC